jgi:ribonuclease HI
MSGAHPWTTIAEMELTAAVEALRSMEGGARIELHSDSEYLIYRGCAPARISLRRACSLHGNFYRNRNPQRANPDV